VCVSWPKIVKKFTYLLDEAVIKIKKINEESIPQHDASAGMVSLM
jgi:GTP cyclohydrolase FolE2